MWNTGYTAHCPNSRTLIAPNSRAHYSIANMLALADFQVTISIDHCIAFYTNIDDNLIERLRKDYDNTCISGCLILRVLKTIRVGECALCSSTQPTIGTLSVAFRALIVNYAPHDIIAGCIVCPIKEHQRIVMQSEYANALIVPAKGEKDTMVLSPGAVVTVVATDVLAQPGANRIAVNARLYEPTTTTFYYPIYRTEKHTECRALTRESYVSLRMHAALQNPSDSLAVDARGDALGMSVRECARDAAQYAREVAQEIRGTHERVPDIVRHLFYPFREERALDPDTALSMIDLVGDTEPQIPPDATCLVVCPEFNPLDGKIAYSTTPIANLPPTWVQGEVAQPLEIVLTRRLESFIGFALAGITTMREFTNSARATASKSLIVLQTSRKK